MTDSWTVSAAYETTVNGRKRYVVVLRSPTGVVAQHFTTASLFEAWNILDRYDHHPALVVHLPPPAA